MQVQINLNAPFEYHIGQQVPKFNFCGDLVAAIDPGKTNMAMVVGTTFGTRLCILQFRAPGAAYDNSDYCQDFKEYISKYFSGCHFKAFGIEKAISKQGMNYHHSSMVLTEIRANLIDLAFELTGSKPIEINNWSWKYATLPDGYRSQSEKGSARLLSSVYAAYGNADVTDAICMYDYLVKQVPTPVTIKPDRAEQPLANYKAYILPAGNPASKTARRFTYEPGLSFEENCAYFINRTWEAGVAALNVDDLTLQDIYSHAVGFMTESAGAVEVVVVRS